MLVDSRARRPPRGSRVPPAGWWPPGSPRVYSKACSTASDRWILLAGGAIVFGALGARRQPHPGVARGVGQSRRCAGGRSRKPGYPRQSIQPCGPARSKSGPGTDDPALDDGHPCWPPPCASSAGGTGPTVSSPERLKSPTVTRVGGRSARPSQNRTITTGSDRVAARLACQVLAHPEPPLNGYAARQRNSRFSAVVAPPSA